MTVPRALRRFPVTDPVRQKAYRIYILPEQLERARARYRGLVREAKRLGMNDLLEPGETGP